MNESVIPIVTAVLSIVSVFLGAKYRKWLAKGKLLAELLNDIIAAAEDNLVSEAEFQSIVAKAKLIAAEEAPQ